VKLIEHMRDDEQVRALIKKAEKDFTRTNKAKLKKDKLPLPDADIEALKGILNVSPLHVGIVDAAENWVVEALKDTARAPNENEWQRLLVSPLDGLIGMSLALQWRYNFGPLFGVEEEDPEE
jgi:hypothetical protein